MGNPTRVATLSDGSDVLLHDDGTPSVHAAGTAQSMGLADHPDGETALRASAPHFADLVTQSVGHPLDTARDVSLAATNQVMGQRVTPEQEAAAGRHPYMAAALTPAAEVAAPVLYAADTAKNGLPENFSGRQWINQNYPTLGRMGDVAESVANGATKYPGELVDAFKGGLQQGSSAPVSPQEDEAAGKHPVAATAGAVAIAPGKALYDLIYKRGK